MPKKVLLFDFDGTLAYRDGMWTATIHELLRTHGYHGIDSEVIEPYTTTGFPWHEYEIPHSEFFNGLAWWEYMEKRVETILNNMGITKNDSAKISKEFRDAYLNIEKWHLFDDTIPALKKAAALEYPCYLLTNHTPEIHEIARRLNISDYLMKIFNSADIGYEKPHYKIFEHAMNGIREEPKNYIMIGDNYISDITGARSCGMNGILVRTPNKFNYKYYCANLDGIFDIINIIEKQRT